MALYLMKRNLVLLGTDHLQQQLPQSLVFDRLLFAVDPAVLLPVINQ